MDGRVEQIAYNEEELCDDKILNYFDPAGGQAQAYLTLT